MAKSPEEVMESMIAGLEAKTGRALPQWTKLVAASGLSRHGDIVAMLKKDHGVTHGYANLIAHKSLASDAVSAAAAGEDLLGAQYSGAKAALRPIYDALAAAIDAFGPDVDLSLKKGYVSLRRGKQFGLIQPSTATRVDVGIQLKGVPPGGRLESSGSFNAMVTHRVRVGSVAEVDGELIGWLRRAYEAA
jgi:hypothetical protein